MSIRTDGRGPSLDAALADTTERGGLTPLQPAGWPKPRGYSNALMGRGQVVCIAGQVGWDTDGTFPADFLAQVHQALSNILAVLAEAGGDASHIARLTWYVTDMDEYRASLPELGQAYRAAMGKNFPAMTLVQVVSLVEPEARVEIEATAILPDPD
ncbi:RidA family protein [Kaustia mangrovi]|uniref:RidA family protein n=1 Tax=Kaustia mangrovi TaxID=2593653 RepID=UPI0031B5F438